MGLVVKRVVVNRKRVEGFLEELADKGVIEAYKFGRVKKPWGQTRYKVWLKVGEVEEEREFDTLKEVFVFVGSFIGGLR